MITKKYFLEEVFGKTMIVPKMEKPTIKTPETQTSIHLHKTRLRRLQKNSKELEGFDYETSE